ncbi:hypothetical protein HP456_04120 [Bacillus haikouensis]|jgi:hypothetical protein|uniref:LiaI-LiaF-like domain-containing protein n=1 Tax=Bacillus haikouensis TaxID=1510468 RepID=UPI001556493D|nr:DUF5668 domain-containing protein [Bacillus haikouensis]NQD65099.1 hypothetical protein [Bacillus haikouensis]
MKQQRIFPGFILIGFGLYFYLQQKNIVLFQEFFTWPTLLMIVGTAFLGQGYGARDYEAILPGTILVGFGLHFHVVNKLEIWPDHMGTFILIISLGFLLRYQKTRNGLFQGILFLTLSIILLFYDKVGGYLGLIEGQVGSAWEFWPIVIIVIGVYLLFIRKK